MICDNFEKEEKVCRYYAALIGTPEEPPTGMENFSGRCGARDDVENWIEVEDEDCDMLDWVEGDEDD